MRTLLLLGALLLALPAAGAEAVSQNPYLSAAEKLFDSLEYEEAELTLNKALTFSGNTPKDDVRIALLFGMLYAETGRPDLATRSFKRALAIDRSAQLPMVSSKVRALFDQARNELGISAEEPPVVEKPAPALPYAKYALIGGGAAAVVGGALLTVSARSFLDKDLSGMSYEEARAEQGREQTKLLAGQALIGAGIIAAGAGAAWLLLDGEPSAVSLYADGRSAGFVLQGDF